MSFLNLALLGGLAAVAIPILIHLLHRSRIKVVKWGAMHLLEKVLLAIQRRVKIKQWLLLAIRCAIPALLALLMARPVWTGVSQLLGESPSSTVVLLDHSYSMEAGSAGISNYHVARGATQGVLTELPRGSEAQVFLMGSGTPLTDQPVYDLTRLSRALTETEASGGVARVSEALDFAVHTFEQMHESARQLLVLTDFQRSSFSPEEQKLIASALERLGRQPGKPQVTFWDVGGAAVENVAIESLDYPKLMVGIGQPVQILAHLRNYGDASHGDLRVTLKVDGADKVISQVTLGPNARQQVLFTLRFETAGSHVVEVGIEADAITADNQFLASIPVHDHVPVLLVDGAPGSNPSDLKSETGFAQIALSPFVTGKVPLSDLIETKVIPTDKLDAKRMAEAAVIVLANVRRLEDAQVKALEEFVKHGGGLLLSPGDRTDAAWWNGPFATLAPLALGGVAGDLKEGTSSANPSSERYESPALELFNDPRNGSMADVAVRMWFQFRAPEQGKADAVVLAHLENGDPFLVEKKLGDGRIIACATAIDSDWSDLPARPIYLPLLQRLCVYLASHVHPARNLQPGEPLLAFLPDTSAGTKAQLTLPDARTIELPIVKTGSRAVIECKDTARPGLYTLQSPQGSAVHYAVNADRHESDPTRLAPEEIVALAKASGVTLVHSAAEYRTQENVRRHGWELWRWLLLPLLGLLFLELIVQQRLVRSKGRSA